MHLDLQEFLDLVMFREDHPGEASGARRDPDVGVIPEFHPELYPRLDHRTLRWTRNEPKWIWELRFRGAYTITDNMIADDIDKTRERL